MNKQNSVLVVGMGMAGLMAAHSALERGKDVTLLATGLGALSIASGCMDLLGYTCTDDNMYPVGNPLNALNALPAEHPYSIIGRPSVEAAFAAIQKLLAKQGAEFLCKGDANTLVSTIIGTLKPTYLYPASADCTPLFAAKRVLVASVDAIRDCHPELIIKQLQKYPALAHVEFCKASLTSHFGNAHRAVSPLDMARYVDSAEGFAWLTKNLKPLIRNVDAVLLPPILGTKIKAEQVSAWKILQEKLAVPVVEMLSLPPAVGGNRLYTLLMNALRTAQFEGTGSLRIVENSTITRAEIEQGRCTALIAGNESGEEMRHEAEAFILATGGILGGGIETEPGKAYEKILGIPLETPAEQEQWAADNAFGAHAFTQMGVKVNNKLQPLDAHGRILAENIHFAGRTLGIYDFAAEKSGNGVALSTAWHAAQQV